MLLTLITYLSPTPPHFTSTPKGAHTHPLVTIHPFIFSIELNSNKCDFNFLSQLKIVITEKMLFLKNDFTSIVI